MDWKEIKRLLDQYFEGNTSLKDDQRIRKALQRDDCPSELKAEMEMMNFFSEAKEIQTPKFDYGFIKKEKTNRFRISPYWTGIAASFALIAIFFFNQNKFQCEHGEVLAIINNERICDQELAKQQADKALALIAQKLNAGTEELNYLKTINTPTIITE